MDDGEWVGAGPGIGLVPDNPVLERLGVRLLALRPGLARFGMEIGPEHLNLQGRLHGGVTATLLDVAGGYAGLLDDEGRPTLNAVTVMLNIGYSAGIGAGRVVAEGRIIGGGRKIYLAEAKLVAADGMLVATAQGTFRRVPKEGGQRKEGAAGMAAGGR